MKIRIPPKIWRQLRWWWWWRWLQWRWWRWWRWQWWGPTMTRTMMMMTSDGSSWRILNHLLTSSQSHRCPNCKSRWTIVLLCRTSKIYQIVQLSPSSLPPFSPPSSFFIIIIIIIWRIVGWSDDPTALQRGNMISRWTGCGERNSPFLSCKNRWGWWIDLVHF